MFPPSGATGNTPATEGWPRTVARGATSLSVYQPQIEQWKDNQLEARSAVAITANQSKQPNFGVIWSTARTEIDKINRLVTLTDFIINKVNFPATPERASACQAILQAQAPKAGQTIELNHVLADMASMRTKIAGARGAGYNPRTGVVSGGAAGATYNAATGQVTAGRKGFAYNTRTDTGVAVGNNNVYAGHDGEVYRYNKSNGLEQHTNSGWQSVNRPTEIQNIQNQQGARITGQQRWENFRSAGSLNGNSGVVGPRLGSGGGPRGGGRIRR